MKPSRLIGTFGILLSIGVGAHSSAHAGAWPMPENRLLVIAPFTATKADEAYNARGKAQPHNAYRKKELAPYLEYGLTKSLTLVSSLAFTSDETNYFGTKFIQRSISRIETGGRLDLGEWRDARYALQALAIFHGSTTGDDPFSSRRGDVDGELGLCTGQNFTFWGLKGFSDTYSAYRFHPAGRPGEIKLDVTIGFRPLAQTMLLVKNESFASIGRTGNDSGIQRVAATKLGLSVVQEIEPPVSLELGYMQTVAGQNIVRERALTLALWYRF